MLRFERPSSRVGLCAARISVVSVLSLAGCGAPAAQVRTVEPASPVEDPFPSSGAGMSVTGTLGTIPQRKIQRVLEARLGAFQRCFAEGAQAVELIGGEAAFSFVVDRTGRVTSVHLHDSSVGHRATERCLLEVAQAAEFPAPKGGEGAEFTWGFAMDASPDLRPPVELDGARLAAETPDVISAVAACNPEPVTITAYVDRGGRTLGAGVSSAAAQAPGVLDCVAQAVTVAVLPDPGSYPGKIRFSVP
jgi:TonB family protein